MTRTDICGDSKKNPPDVGNLFEPVWQDHGRTHDGPFCFTHFLSSLTLKCYCYYYLSGLDRLGYRFLDSHSFGIHFASIRDYGPGAFSCDPAVCWLSPSYAFAATAKGVVHMLSQPALSMQYFPTCYPDGSLWLVKRYLDCQGKLLSHSGSCHHLGSLLDFKDRTSVDCHPSHVHLQMGPSGKERLPGVSRQVVTRIMSIFPLQMGPSGKER